MSCQNINLAYICGELVPVLLVLRVYMVHSWANGVRSQF